MGTNGDAPWDRYELGDTIQQYQRISRTEAKHKASGMPVWIDKLQPYYGDHPDGLAAAREYLLAHGKVSHPALPIPVDAWEYDGALSWVYRVQMGTPLRDSLAEHRPSLAALESLVADLAGALSAIHQAGLVHGSLDIDTLVMAGRRRLAFVNRGIRTQLNDLFNRSTLEGGLNRTPTGSRAEDLAAWGEILGVLITGEPSFGRIVLSSRSAGAFEQREAEEALRRKAIVGRLPQVILKAVKGRSSPDETYADMGKALDAFRDALAVDLGEQRRQA